MVADVNLHEAISIHALREEGDTYRRQYHGSYAISIHALREEGDQPHFRRTLSGSYISIHALREEGDSDRVDERAGRNHFYPRPPRGGRRRFIYSPGVVREFLSTPSARRATHEKYERLVVSEFLSTPSARRATRFCRRASGSGTISIHALREEGDSGKSEVGTPQGYFYPRPPRGGRPHESCRVRRP